MLTASFSALDPALEFGYDTLATERAGLRPVQPHEHVRSSLLRRTPVGLDDRAVNARQSPAQGVR
jgi:hypothetical protein